MTSNRETLIEVVVDAICINATAQRHPYDAAFAILKAINAAGFEVVPKLHSDADGIWNAAREEIEALKHDIARHVAAVAAERDAALEEAAQVAEAVDPEKPANWLHARHKIAFEIRALRARAQEMGDE